MTATIMVVAAAIASFVPLTGVGVSVVFVATAAAVTAAVAVAVVGATDRCGSQHALP